MIEETEEVIEEVEIVVETSEGEVTDETEIEMIGIAAKETAKAKVRVEVEAKAAIRKRNLEREAKTVIDRQ